jgi:hypothetical protein
VELSLDASWGLVSKHPRAASGPLQEDIRYYIRSRRFAAEFVRVGPPTIFGEIQKRCYGRKGPIGHGQFRLTNDRGEQHEFRFETFFNGYDALTFGTWLAARPVAVAMRAS